MAKYASIKDCFFSYAAEQFQRHAPSRPGRLRRGRHFALCCAGCVSMWSLLRASQSGLAAFDTCRAGFPSLTLTRRRPRLRDPTSNPLNLASGIISRLVQCTSRPRRLRSILVTFPIQLGTEGFDVGVQPPTLRRLVRCVQLLLAASVQVRVMRLGQLVAAGTHLPRA